MSKPDNSEKWMVWVLWMWAINELIKSHDWWAFGLFVAIAVLAVISKFLDLIMDTLDAALRSLGH